MECCSKSDEKIAAGGEGEGVSDDRRGVTWLELDARDLEFVSFSWLFTAAWAVIAAAYHSQATRLIEWTSGTTLLWTKRLSQTFISRKKNSKTCFATVQWIVKRAAMGCFIWIRTRFKKRAGIHIEASNEQLVRLSIESQVGKRWNVWLVNTPWKYYIGSRGKYRVPTKSSC